MNRIRVIRLVLALVVVLVFGCLYFTIFRAREPRFQGHTLSEWMEKAEVARYTYKPGGRAMYPRYDPDCQEACRAIRQMTPDAIPLLIKWAQAKDSRLKVKVITWLNRHKSFHIKVKSADEYHRMAFLGFNFLRNKADPALPVLIKLTDTRDPDLRISALNCLVTSTSDMKTLQPVLQRLNHDPFQPIHVFAGRMLIGPSSDEVEGIEVYQAHPWLKDFYNNGTLGH